MCPALTICQKIMSNCLTLVDQNRTNKLCYFYFCKLIFYFLPGFRANFFFFHGANLHLTGSATLRPCPVYCTVLLQPPTFLITCRHLPAVVRPDVVLFGESMPKGFETHQQEDFQACDLLLVIGTSLNVR